MDVHLLRKARNLKCLAKVISRHCSTKSLISRRVKLSYASFQATNKETKSPPLLMMHGMFGNKKNFESIAKALSRDGRKVITLDARNHGESPHEQDMDYFLMSEDVEQLMLDLELKQAILLGHSMGGKMAMVLALTKPHLVSKLIVADIAPDVTRTAGDTGFPNFITAMRNVLIKREAVKLLSQARKEASKQLEAHVPEKELRDFVVTNLEQRDEQFQWRVNLKSICDNIDALVSFPRIDACYQGDTLFIRGGKSTAVKADNEADIRRLFPESRIMTIHGAGHWVHADKPHEFIKAIRGFIDHSDIS